MVNNSNYSNFYYYFHDDDYYYYYYCYYVSPPPHQSTCNSIPYLTYLSISLSFSLYFLSLLLTSFNMISMERNRTHPLFSSPCFFSERSALSHCGTFSVCLFVSVCVCVSAYLCIYLSVSGIQFVPSLRHGLP